MLRRKLLIMSLLFNCVGLLIGGLYAYKTRSYVIAWYEKYMKNETPVSPRTRYHRMRLEALNALQQQLADKRIIIFAGDSLIQTFPWETYYTRRMPGTLVVNSGIGGEIIGGLLDRYETTFFGLGRPDRIFIMVGLNDINQAVTRGDVRIGELTKRYQMLLEKLSARVPAERICIHSILPVRGRWAAANQVIKGFNEWFHEYAHTNGFCYIDLYERFVDGMGQLGAEYALDDGIHLTAEGYGVWLEVLTPYVSNQPMESRQLSSKFGSTLR